jgi:hypothetical protein
VQIRSAIPFLLGLLLTSVGESRAAADLTPPPADPAEQFVAANGAYEEADYSRAIESYRDVVTAGIQDGRLYFNLGNAYLRNGELGRAIASYRRARVLRPRDQDLRANQSFARGSIKDAIEPPEPSAVVSTLLFWYYALSPNELALLVLLVNLLFWSSALVRVFRPDSEVLRWTSIVLLILLIFTAGPLFARRWLSPSVAVVLPQEIDAFTGPSLDSVVRFKLHAGTEVRVRDDREGWVRIALPDHQQGWVEAEWLDVVE